MANRPTIEDLARESGVSVATVDRVLNGRAKVRQETSRQVYDAAIKIGYHAAGLIKQRMDAHKPEYHLGFVFHKEGQDFYRNLKDAFEKAARYYNAARIEVEIAFVPNHSPAEFANIIAQLGERNQALGAIAIDHHQVTEMVRKLQTRNVPVFSLLNDFAQGVRQSYIGLNNVRVGRGTAWMLSKIARLGKVALFVGGHRWHGHELRETGFRSFFREYAPQFTLLDTLVNLETRQLTYEAMLDLLQRHKDLTAVYCAGGGMEGAIQAVRELRPPDEIAMVVNEDTPITRQALLERYLVMANVTPLADLAHETITQMVRAIETPTPSILGQTFLQQNFLFPEMI